MALGYAVLPLIKTRPVCFFKGDGLFETADTNYVHGRSGVMSCKVRPSDRRLFLTATSHRERYPRDPFHHPAPVPDAARGALSRNSCRRRGRSIFPLPLSGSLSSRIHCDGSI